MTAFAEGKTKHFYERRRVSLFDGNETFFPSAYYSPLLACRSQVGDRSLSLLEDFFFLVIPDVCPGVKGRPLPLSTAPFNMECMWGPFFLPPPPFHLFLVITKLRIFPMIARFPQTFFVIFSSTDKITISVSGNSGADGFGNDRSGRVFPLLHLSLFTSVPWRPASNRLTAFPFCRTEISVRNSNVLLPF